ncbi:MAG: FAD-dependent oxidoreductase [Dehalococcoidales bacterium]|nr:FAD-dependent oxidoreductase [Dehalococcoidales bacterium]
MRKTNFLIIGGVAAGMSAASKIRSLLPEAEIHVFEKSGYVSYAGCGMPYFIAGMVPSSKNLVTYDSDFFKQKRNIDVHLHHEMTGISPTNKTVAVRDTAKQEEKSWSYDRLLISTGARPVLPPIKGSELRGVFSLRLLEQCLDIDDYVSKNSPKHALIIGAGNIGMEMAQAFSARGMEITLVEKAPAILGSMDDEINEAVEEELKKNRVTLIKSQAAVEFQGDNSAVRRAVLENGDSLTADIVLISTGIRPNSEIARQAGIELGQAGAIKVDSRMQTSVQDIFAAGDCAEAYHLLYGRNVYMPLGTTANKQGRVAGSNMAGTDAFFAGIVGTAVFKVYDLEVGRTGLSEKDARREGIDVVTNTVEHLSRAHYFPGAGRIRVKLTADRKTGKIIGAQMVGKEGVAKRIDVFAAAITAGMTAAQVENLDLGYAPPFAPVYDPVLIAAGDLNKKIPGTAA